MKVNGDIKEITDQQVEQPRIISLRGGYATMSPSLNSLYHLKVTSLQIISDQQRIESDQNNVVPFSDYLRYMDVYRDVMTIGFDGSLVFHDRYLVIKNEVTCLSTGIE